MPSKSYFKKKALSESLDIKIVRAYGADLSDSKKLRLQYELQQKIWKCARNQFFCDVVVGAGSGFALSDVVSAWYVSGLSHVSLIFPFSLGAGAVGYFIRNYYLSEKSVCENEYGALFKNE